MVAIPHSYHRTPLPKVRIQHRRFLPDVIEMKFRVEVFNGFQYLNQQTRQPINIYEEWQPVTVRYMVNVLQLLLKNIDVEDVL